MVLFNLSLLCCILTSCFISFFLNLIFIVKQVINFHLAFLINDFTMQVADYEQKTSYDWPNSLLSKAPPFSRNISKKEEMQKVNNNQKDKLKVTLKK